MKLFFSVLLFSFFSAAISAQKAITQPLPMPYYLRMIDSTTSIDVVFMLGQGGSISVEGRNTRLFNSFFESVTTAKLNTPQAGSVMWQINGKEFLSGSIYLGDSTGCLVITKNGKEYVNRINPQGNNFFRSNGRKQ